MWTQLQNKNHIQPRILSEHELQALLEEPRHQYPTPKSHARVVPPGAPAHGNPRRNLILGALSEADYDAVTEMLDVVNLTAGQVIYESGDVLQHVYFPATCTASLLSTTADGETAELALTGRSGLIGVPLVLGGNSMGHSVQIQCAGQAYRMTAERFMHFLRVCNPLKQLALSYVQSLMTQMAQSIVCSRHHSVSERLSQWMLWNADGLDSHELSVTHETIAHMLGVRRESITQAAGKLQAAGYIHNSRGKITIKNREGLLNCVCECYGRIKSDADRYLQRLNHLNDCTEDFYDHSSTHTDEKITPSHQLDLQKYVDAYDFAPVGFITLNSKCLVTQINLAGAIMLDIQRSQCQHRNFLTFLDEKSRLDFMGFHHEVLRGQCRRFCLVTLPATAHRPAMTLRIDATSDESGEENRMVMIDVGHDYPAEKQPDAPFPWQFKTTPGLDAGVFNV